MTLCSGVWLALLVAAVLMPWTPAEATEPPASGPAVQPTNSGLDPLAHCATGPAAELPPTPALTAADEHAWRRFMARQDLTWDSGKNAMIEPGFFHGAFLGDGTAGGMVFRDPAQPGDLRWLMSRYDVVAHGMIPKLEYCDPRLFAGSIMLSPAGRTTHESMRLSLWDGQASGVIRTDRGTLDWRAYVHRTQHVFVMVVRTTGKERDATLRVKPEWGISPVIYRKRKDPADYAEYLPPKPTVTHDGHITLITQPLKAPAAYAVAWTVRSTAPDTRVLLATIGAAYDEHASAAAMAAAAQCAAAERLRAVREIPLAHLDASHQAWWHQHMSRARLALPDDPKWEAFWWRQIYKFASASSGHSSLMIDNDGPWAYDCDWGAIWWNLNLQLSYFPTFSANQFDVGRSLLNGIDRLYRSGVLGHNAGMYAGDSLWVGRSTDYLGAGSWGDEAGNLTWVLFNCWRYAAYSGDDAVARWLFPILKQDINHYLHMLHRGKDGKLHMPPTRSPEYEDVLRTEHKPDLMPDTTYALASLRWGLQTLLKLDQRFALHDPLRPRWEQTLRDLTPLPVDQTGLKIAAGQDYDHSHRHYSHLLAIYPYHLITPDQGLAARDLIQRSVDQWTSMPEAFAGYSYTGACAMYAILGEGDKAIGWLDKLLGRVQPNTLHEEGGNQVIETPLSAVEALDYLLLQSWGGKVRVFPAVPARWRDVSFDNFAAEGAFLVSAERREGKTTSIRVRSVKGNPLRLVLPPDMPAGSYRISAPAGVQVAAAHAGIIEVTLPASTVLRIDALQQRARGQDVPRRGEEKDERQDQ